MIPGTFPIIAGNAPPVLTYLTSGSNTGALAATRTVSGLSFGTEAADRYLIAAVTCDDSSVGSTITAVTIGGISATISKQYTLQVGEIGIAIAAVPTGASGNVAVTVNDPYATLSVGLWSVTGLFSPTAHDTAQDGFATGANRTLDVSLDIPGDGFAIGVVYQQNIGGSLGNEVWTGMTERYFIALGFRPSGADTGVIGAPATPQSVTISGLTGDRASLAISASYR